MTEATGPGDAFAIGNDEQYRPVQTVGAQRVLVSGPEGTGLLACDASGPLGGPQRGPVVVVVHGALRDSDRYLASARHAARLAASDALIVAQGANRLDRGLRYGQHVRGLARATGLPFRHRLIRLADVGHTAADVLAAPQTREIVFAGSRGQPRA